MPTGARRGAARLMPTRPRVQKAGFHRRITLKPRSCYRFAPNRGAIAGNPVGGAGPAQDKEVHMRRKALAGVLSAAALAITASPAFAESDQQACEAAGGTYTKVQGTSSCAFPVGNMPPGQQGGDTIR